MKNKASNSLNVPLVLFIVFLVLKLTKNIDWSWWWVTSPLWIPISVVLSIIVIAVLLIVIMIGFGLIDVKELKNKIEEKKKSIKS